MEYTPPDPESATFPPSPPDASILPVTEMVHTLFHSFPLVIEETSAAAHDRTPLVIEEKAAAVQASILPVSGE